MNSKQLLKSNSAILSEDVKLLNRLRISIPETTVANIHSNGIAPAAKKKQLQNIDDDLNIINVKVKQLVRVDSTTSFISFVETSRSCENPHSLRSDISDVSPDTSRTECTGGSGRQKTYESQESDASYERFDKMPKKDPKKLGRDDDERYITEKFLVTLSSLETLVHTVDAVKSASNVWVGLHPRETAEEKMNYWELFQAHKGPQWTIQTIKTFSENAECQAKACEVLYYYLTWLQIKFSVLPGNESAFLPPESHSRALSFVEEGLERPSIVPKRKSMQQFLEASHTLSPIHTKSWASDALRRSNSNETPHGEDEEPQRVQQRARSRTPTFTESLSAGNSTKLEPLDISTFRLEDSFQALSAGEEKPDITINLKARTQSLHQLINTRPATSFPTSPHRLHRKSIPLVKEDEVASRPRCPALPSDFEYPHITYLLRQGCVQALLTFLYEADSDSSLLSCLKAMSRITNLSKEASRYLFSTSYQFSHSTSALHKISQTKNTTHGLSILLAILSQHSNKHQLISYAAKALFAALESDYPEAATVLAQCQPCELPLRDTSSKEGGGTSVDEKQSRRHATGNSFFAGVATLMVVCQNLEEEEEPFSGVTTPKSGLQARGTVSLLARQWKQLAAAQKALCKIIFTILSESKEAARSVSRMPKARPLLRSLLLRFGMQDDMEVICNRFLERVPFLELTFDSVGRVDKSLSPKRAGLNSALVSSSSGVPAGLETTSTKQRTPRSRCWTDPSSHGVVLERRNKTPSPGPRRKLPWEEQLKSANDKTAHSRSPSPLRCMKLPWEEQLKLAKEEIAHSRSPSPLRCIGGTFPGPNDSLSSSVYRQSRVAVSLSSSCEPMSPVLHKHNRLKRAEYEPQLNLQEEIMSAHFG